MRHAAVSCSCPTPCSTDMSSAATLLPPKEGVTKVVYRPTSVSISVLIRQSHIHTHTHTHTHKYTYTHTRTHTHAHTHTLTHTHTHTHTHAHTHTLTHTHTHTHTHAHIHTIYSHQFVILKPALLPPGTTHTVLLPPQRLGKVQVGVAAGCLAWHHEPGQWLRLPADAFSLLQPFVLAEQCDGLECALPLSAWGMGSGLHGVWTRDLNICDSFRYLFPQEATYPLLPTATALC